MPLNSTEIAILGGLKDLSYVGDVFTFNTSTNEFNKREVEEGGISFVCLGNYSAQISENAIFALVKVQDEEKECLIKYTKEDNRITRLPSGE